MQRTPTKTPSSRRSKGKLQPRPISKIERAAPDWNGRYELQLRGRAGVIVDEIDLRGKVVASNAVQQAEPGSDIVTTFDPALQRTAETLLTQAIARRIAVDGALSDNQSGGAVVVMNIHDGAILAAASAPRFDPNVFVERDNQEIEHLLTDACRPLFDRTVQMALPPGSVFKVVSAAAPWIRE